MNRAWIRFKLSQRGLTTEDKVCLNCKNFVSHGNCFNNCWCSVQDEETRENTVCPVDSWDQIAGEEG